MQLIPNDLYEKLEFNKILELLETNCLGELGSKVIQELTISTNFQAIEQSLHEVKEYKINLEQRHNFPIQNYESISGDLRMLMIEGFVLPIEGLQRINNILLQTAEIFKFFNKTSFRELYPYLYEVVRAMPFDEDLQQEIVRVIDENGEIRSDASPELSRIRKRMATKRKELDKRFREVINLYQSKGWLSENVESFRNGRRVLSVPVEHKRKIRGIIHDESATGRTTFIEPEPIIEINNDIFDLENEEKREIYRILKQLSDTIRPYTPHLDWYQQCIVRYDVIQAKAVLALYLNGQMPQLKENPNVHWVNAYHPLLYLKNKRNDKKTVPFSLTFLNNNRILVLSGPNAGGKSIAMKSVGLLQLMVQAGMLVPAHPTSEVGIFEKFFADIGDQQSLEDDLSTYSSRLQNARLFVENADEKTLVLIDEFGSGTDPKIGGAIAEAILNSLHQRQVFGVITTHYSNLKVFAFRTKGIINGSMNFDTDHLRPTYELKVGRPGSSYAFEIAQKTGLQEEILSYAKRKTGANEKAVDELLVDLQREKQEVEEYLQNLKARQTQLDKLMQSYEELQRDLEFNRKKAKLEAKTRALQETAQTNKMLENLVREIRETQNIERAKQLAQQAKESRKVVEEQVKELTEEVYYKPIPAKKMVQKEAIQVGDFVRLKTGGSTGTIESLDKDNAVVAIGLMKLVVRLRDLQHANEPLEVRTEKSVQTDILTSHATFDSKLDIRGMRREEALQLIESFVDEAIISNIPTLRIVHGKGNGVLRAAVKQKLREYKEIQHIRHEPEEQGGVGVTIVELE